MLYLIDLIVRLYTLNKASRISIFLVFYVLDLRGSGEALNTLVRFDSSVLVSYVGTRMFIKISLGVMLLIGLTG